MFDLYLIAHRVRGQPAFDIAVRMCEDIVPCQSKCGLFNGQICRAKEEDWWVIPTSGHRAYPWQYWALTDLEGDIGHDYWAGVALEMPTDLQDHYNIDQHLILKEYTKEEIQAGVDLLKLIGLDKPVPQPPIVRRI